MLSNGAHAARATTMRSGEVARRSGVNVGTLRYYERRGLIRRPDRTLGGHRKYPDDTVALVQAIKAAQRLGFALDEVSELLNVRGRSHVTPDLQASAAAKIAEIDERISDLHAIRDGLSEILAAECESLAGCTCDGCPIPYVPSTAAADSRASA